MVLPLLTTPTLQLLLLTGELDGEVCITVGDVKLGQDLVSTEYLTGWPQWPDGVLMAAPSASSLNHEADHPNSKINKCKGDRALGHSPFPQLLVEGAGKASPSSM